MVGATMLSESCPYWILSWDMSFVSIIFSGSLEAFVGGCSFTLFCRSDVVLYLLSRIF